MPQSKNAVSETPPLYAPGDVVTLRDIRMANPDMAVKAVDSWLVTCQWFEGKQLHEAIFHEATLHRRERPAS